jgi:hypothetical protein
MPAGGKVEIGLIPGHGEGIVRVKDTGAGVTENERDAADACPVSRHRRQPGLRCVVKADLLQLGQRASGSWN